VTKRVVVVGAGSGYMDIGAGVGALTGPGQIVLLGPSTAPASVTVSQDNTTIILPDSASGSTFTMGGSITSLTLQGAGKATIVGNTASNTITGNSGVNTVSYSTSIANATFGMSSGKLTVTIGLDIDTLDSVEKLVFSDQTVWVVSPTRSGYTTIGSAVAASSAGDMILVMDGSYTESVVVSKRLSLRSVSGSGSTEITGVTGSGNAAIKVASGIQNVEIGGSGKGFTLNAGSADAALVFAGDNDNSTVTGNVVAGGTKPALVVEPGQSTVSFVGNSFSSSAAIVAEVKLGSSAVSFTGSNSFTGESGAGVLLSVSSTGGTISNNTFAGSSSVAKLELVGTGNSVSVNSFGGDAGLAIRNAAADATEATLAVANTFSPGYAYPSAVATDSNGIWTSIQGAVTAAAASATVNISSGTYAETSVNVGVEGLTLELGSSLGSFTSAVLTGTVQNLTLTGTGDLNVTGNTAANSLVGNAAANTLTGNEGDDVLTGGDGADTLQGGLGVDVAVFSGNLADYTVTPGATGAFTVKHKSSNVTDTLTDIEVLKFADKYLVTATQSLQYTIDKADNNSIIEVLAADHSATAVTVNNKSLTIQGPAAITAAESDHARLPQITKSGTGTLTLDKVWIKGTSGVGLVLTGGDFSLTNSVVSVSATTGDPVGVSVGTGFGHVTVTGS